MKADIARLLERLSDRPSSAERQEVGRCLVALGDGAVDALFEIGEERQDERQAAAIHALGAMGTPFAVDALACLLASSDSSHQAARELAGLGPAGEEALLGALASHVNPEPVRVAARALADLGSARAVEPLLTALERRNGWGHSVVLGVTRSLVDSLGTLAARGFGRGAVVRALVPFLQTGGALATDVRDEIMRALTAPPSELAEVQDDDLTAIVALGRVTQTHFWYEEDPWPGWKSEERGVDVAALQDRARQILAHRQGQG